MSVTSIRGLGAAAGVAIGPVYRLKTQRFTAERRAVNDIERERDRLAHALAAAGNEFKAIAAQTRERIGEDEAAIFEAHTLFLEDPDLLERVFATIETEQVNAEFAWQEGTVHYAAMLRSLDDEYLAARADDVEDVAQRVLRLMQGADYPPAGPADPAVIVAADLLPSDLVALESTKLLALCCAKGGATSHVTLLAKSLGIPVIVGLGDQLMKLIDGETVIVDGTTGELLIGPDQTTLAQYQDRAALLTETYRTALQSAHRPAITLDGTQVTIMANVGNETDVDDVLAFGAEGIGLLRTEFLFSGRRHAPTEDEQTAIYRRVLEAFDQRSVVVRTLDLGGDKSTAYLKPDPEPNPFLGLRGTRFLLANPDMLETQLRALLRAGEGTNLKIMFPMITTLEELRRAKSHLVRAGAALEARGVPFSRQTEVGIMIEVPAAALIADRLAEEVDFFSIGTNDLAQYTMAADRTNAEVAGLADPFHPAVVRLIRLVIDAAHASGRWVGLCGELAGDPLATPLLLGLGLDEFSMNPRAIPLAKEAVRRFSLANARKIAEKALELSTADDIRSYLESAKAT